MKKILVVEDDIDTLDMVETILQDAGYAVIKINRGISMTEIRSIRPDLIIVDFLLPHKMGHEICNDIKESSETKHIPVVLYSASNLPQKIIDECRADAFIAKPFDVNYFLSVIDRLAK